LLWEEEWRALGITQVRHCALAKPCFHLSRMGNGVRSDQD
jgi:hypothetical protein